MLRQVICCLVNPIPHQSNLVFRVTSRRLCAARITAGSFLYFSGTVIFLKSGRFSDHTSLRTSLTSAAYLSSSFWAFSPEVASNISSSRKERVVFMVMAFYVQLFV